MKFTVTITKEVIDHSLMCQTPGNEMNPPDNCALAYAINQIVPVSVLQIEMVFWGNKKKILCTTRHTAVVHSFIHAFDRLRYDHMRRYELVGSNIEVDIPEEVIEYWHQDAVTAAQKLIDNPILQPVTQ